MEDVKTPSKTKKVLVALSGGVDSAVSAALLKEQGYLVEGAHMVCWSEGPYCTSPEDRAAAAKVAAHLNIPFQVFDFRQEYRDAVIDYFFAEYEAGRTPNPDVACNREIKFGIFLKKALELGFDYIATGHYAQVKSEIGIFNLLAGVDQNKDQSYFLYNLTQKQLNHTLFPIGSLTKEKVRQLALKLDLPNATRKDSQGICFIGDVEIKEFLRTRIKNRIGEVITTSGEVIGEHQGVAFYTIGQREGFQTKKNIPHYVVEKQGATNKLVVAPLGDESHFRNTLVADSVNWVSSLPEEGSRVKARIRYRQPLFEAKIEKITPSSFTLGLIEAQRAVTAGQSVVIYNDTQVLGGGIIS